MTHLTNWTAELMNACLVVGEEAMLEYLVEPSVQPPTASSTFSRGFRLFKFTNLSRASEKR